MAQIESSRSPGYRGMLAVVIILGILIILGVIGLILAAVLRVSRPANPTPAFSATVPAPGEHLDSVQTDGNRIVLHLSGPKGDEIVIMDSTGHLLGRIGVETTP
jgi:hypothetical protein